MKPFSATCLLSLMIHATVGFSLWQATHLSGAGSAQVTLNLDLVPTSAVAPHETENLPPHSELPTSKHDDDHADPTSVGKIPIEPPSIGRSTRIKRVQDPHPQSRSESKFSSRSSSRYGQQGTREKKQYLDEVLALLEQHKDYPRQARRLGIEGTCTLHLELTPQGAVLVSQVVHSSGSTILDYEVLAMVKRAQPFPKSPLGLAEGLSLNVPVEFRLAH